jgi:hypothetical protein
MDVFAPDNLPGVGMGDLQSIAAALGLVGLATTSGALLAEGLIGTVLFVASAFAVLSEKHDFGGALPATVAVLVLLVLAAIGRLLLVRSARAVTAGLAGAAKDAPETRAAAKRAAGREAWAWRLAILATAVGGAAAGFAWSEWNEVPFQVGDTESLVGLALGVVAAAFGGDAAWRFLQGAVRAGGSSAIVGVVVCVVAYLLNVASVYVPFVGGVVFLLAVVLAVRLRRRQQQKYAGLRILS